MKHFIIAAGVAWGHVRPLIAVSLRLAQLNPDIHLTVFLPQFLAKRVEVERARYDFEKVKDRVHIILGGEEREALVGSKEYAEMLGKIGQETVGYYQQLVSGQKMLDSVSGEQVQPWNTTPDTVIIDISLFPAVFGIKQINATTQSSTQPKLLSFLPLGQPSTRFNASDKFLDLVEKVRAAPDRMEGYQKYIVESETLFEIPGMIPFYSHELDPNTCTVHLYDIWAGLAKGGRAFDGSITVWPTVLSHGLVKGDHSRGYVIGSTPLPSENDKVATAMDKTQQSQQSEIVNFLNQQQKTNGDHSVVYISFGSLEFSPNKEKLWNLFTALDELKIPYIMSGGNAPPSIADEIPARVEQSQGRGIYVKWVPQVLILRHPATMGFVSHGGSNSTLEALLCGVPLIQWPYGWDQPMIANQMESLGVAIELLQVRGEHNVGRKTARGVTVQGTPEAIVAEMKEALGKLRGSSGEQIRAKVKEVGDQVKKDMSEGGEGYEQLKALAHISAEAK